MLTSCKNHLTIAAGLTSALFFAPLAVTAHAESASSLPTVTALRAAHDAHQNLAKGNMSAALKALETSVVNIERVTAQDPSAAFLPLGTVEGRDDIASVAIPARSLPAKLRAAKNDLRAGKTQDAREKLQTVLRPLGMTDGVQTVS